MHSISRRARVPAGRFGLFIRLFIALALAMVTAPFLLASSTSAAPNDKVVVCKYVSTPGGVLDHIVIVDESTLGNPQQPWSGVLPFIWTDAQGQTEVGSIAIRYANPGEQAHDVDPAECPQEEPPVCPPGTDNEGEEIPEGETEESFCNDPAPVCPPGTDNEGQEIPEGETEGSFCDEDDPIVPPNPPNPPNPPAPPNDPTLPDTGLGDLGALALLSGLVMAAGAGVLRRSRRIGVPTS